IVSADATTTTTHVEWDRRVGDVRAEERTTFGAIVMTARPLATTTDATDALLDGVRTEGLDLLPGWVGTETYRSRVEFCRHVLGDEWPDLSELALLDSIDDWLRPWLATATKRADLDKVDVREALRALVDPHLH